jgi:hypothetical protein
MARLAQKKGYLAYDEPAKRVEFDQLPDHALPQFTSMLIDGIKRSVMRSDTVPDGTERKMTTVEPNTGSKITSFIRPDGESFVKEPAYGAGPCRRVIGGLFQKDVGWLQQGVNDRALRQGIPQYDAKRNTFGNSRE